MVEFGGKGGLIGPKDVIQYTGLPRTTLFRWEAQGELGVVSRGRKAVRNYDFDNLSRIHQSNRAIIEKKIMESVNFGREGDLPGLYERLYLSLMMVDPNQALEKLYEQAQAQPLSESCIGLLIRQANGKEKGNPLRVLTWKTLIASDSHAPQLNVV